MRGKDEKLIKIFRLSRQIDSFVVGCLFAFSGALFYSGSGRSNLSIPEVDHGNFKLNPIAFDSD
jgi:hypothetical protein